MEKLPDFLLIVCMKICGKIFFEFWVVEKQGFPQFVENGLENFFGEYRNFQTKRKPDRKAERSDRVKARFIL